MEKKYIYVDKTEILYKIFQNCQHGNLFRLTAPRRFGKSLLLSTIRCMFSQDENWWQKYGSDLWVTKSHPEFFKRIGFPIIKFNFRNVETVESFHDVIKRKLNHYVEKYFLGENLLNTHSFENFFLIMAALTQKFNGQKPIILIDEYDYPFTVNLHNKEITEMERIQILNTFSFKYAGFYKTFKDYQKSFSFLVICGRCLIDLATLFSGLKTDFFNHEIFV